MKYSSSWIYDNYTRPLLDNATTIISKELDEMPFNSLRREKRSDEDFYYVDLPKSELLYSILKTPSFPFEELEKWLNSYGWELQIRNDFDGQEVYILHAITTPEKD